MKRTTFLMALLLMLCLASKAQKVPEGAHLLYHSETRGSNNGLYLTHFTIYELSGKYYMRRIRGFAGAMSPIRNKKDKIEHLPEVTFVLSKSQVRNIQKWLKESPVESMAKVCAEEIANTPPKDPKKLSAFVWGVGGPTHYRKVIEWPDVMTGVMIDFDVEYGDYQKPEYKQRFAFVGAVSEIDEKLEEIGYKYVKKNINKLWREYH